MNISLDKAQLKALDRALFLQIHQLEQDHAKCKNWNALDTLGYEIWVLQEAHRVIDEKLGSLSDYSICKAIGIDLVH